MFDVLEHACTEYVDIFFEGRRIFSRAVKVSAIKIEISLVLFLVFISSLVSNFGSHHFDEDVTWRRISLDSTKMFMSYSSTFVVISVTLLDFFLKNPKTTNNFNSSQEVLTN